ncbi:MAG: hypothetical protein U5L45_05655 [Saprospiraceae bacterium]|nr:hypothetical protein [Saprospiraceae bacterium]
MENNTEIPFNKPSVIGHAQSNFETLIKRNKLYIDRTDYIRAIENHSNTNLLFACWHREFGILNLTSECKQPPARPDHSAWVF